MRAVNASNVLDVFCSCYAVISFQLLAKHSSAALPCKQFFNKCLYMRKHFVHPFITHRAVLIPGICIGIGPILAIFDGIGIGKVCYTSTNSYC